MSTRSMIAKLLPDGRVQAIWCHWDRYPSHNGRVLHDHYATPDKVDALLRLGDLDSLNELPGKKHWPISGIYRNVLQDDETYKFVEDKKYVALHNKECNALARDYHRAEGSAEYPGPRTYDNLQRAVLAHTPGMAIEWAYLFRDDGEYAPGYWLCLNINQNMSGEFGLDNGLWESIPCGVLVEIKSYTATDSTAARAQELIKWAEKAECAVRAR